MKKLTRVLGLLLVLTLFSFSKNAIADNTFKIPKTNRGTCPAPYNLDANRTSTVSVALSWTSGPGINWNVGGYYNWIDSHGNPQTSSFHIQTYTYPVSLTIPAGAYSITFQVTITCTDGTNSTSAPKSKAI